MCSWVPLAMNRELVVGIGALLLLVVPATLYLVSSLATGKSQNPAAEKLKIIKHVLSELDKQAQAADIQANALVSSVDREKVSDLGATESRDMHQRVKVVLDKVLGLGLDVEKVLPHLDQIRGDEDVKTGRKLLARHATGFVLPMLDSTKERLLAFRALLPPPQ